MQIRSRSASGCWLALGSLLVVSCAARPNRNRSEVGAIDSRAGMAAIMSFQKPSAPSRGADTAGASAGSGAPSTDAGAPSGTGTQPEGAGGGYLHTDGNALLDANGDRVRLTGLSWFGMETASYAPHGLAQRSLESILDQVNALGYNMLRLPFCNQLFDSGSNPSGIDYAKNPSLNGAKGLALLDKVVAAAAARGLKIVLDRHRPDSNAQSALWYTSKYSEQRFIDDWTMLAAHYQGNAAVIGFDLHNEPHDPATWGDGNMQTDWKAAAERAGNAVLAVNSDLLIIVEGIQSYDNAYYWWGGNLRGVADHPVELAVADRLVYSAHDYPSSVRAQNWFDDPTYPDNLPRVWDDAWGFIDAARLAPVWLGEFGTKDQSASDMAWFSSLTDYIEQRQLSFAFWCLNPDSGDTGGILSDDWNSVNQNKQSLLAPLLAPLLP